MRPAPLRLLPLLALLTLAACGGPDLELDPDGVARYGAYRYEPGAPQRGGASADAPLQAVDLGRVAAPAPAAAAAPAAPAGGAPVMGKPKKGAKYEAGPVEKGGTIQVSVKLTRAPEGGEFRLNKDQGAGKCGHDTLPNERAKFDAATLGLENAIVYLVDVAKGKAFEGDLAEPERMVTVDQQGCVYRPHVMLVRAGSRLAVKNSDPVQHNVKGYLNNKATPRFNIMSSSNSELPPSDDTNLDKPGTYLLSCDIHLWMTGFIRAVAHPYHAITGPDGKATLTNVPPGEYRIGCWHEGMLLRVETSGPDVTGYVFSDGFDLPEQTVTVPPEGTVDVAFTTDPR